MKVNLNAGWLYAALIIVLSVLVLQSFLHALLAAAVTAIASWPLYKRFAARLPWRLRRSAAALIFTSMMTVFVLAPLLVAFLALLTEVNELVLKIAAADAKGIGVPHWLESMPLAGATPKMKKSGTRPAARIASARSTQIGMELGLPPSTMRSRK